MPVRHGRPRSKEISGTTERIFTKFSALVELFKGLINLLHLMIAQGTLPWQPIKFAKSAFLRTNFHCRAAIRKLIRIS